MYDVFISHASQDHEVAERICFALEQADLKCWIAPRDLTAGSSFPGALSGAIQKSRAVLVVCSEKTNESKHVLREVILADEINRPLIPVRIQPVSYSTGLKYMLADSHWLDALTPLDQNLDRLVSDIYHSVRTAKPEVTDTPLEGTDRVAYAELTTSTISSLPLEQFRKFVDRIRLEYRPYRTNHSELDDPNAMYVPLKCLSLSEQSESKDAVDWLAEGIPAGQKQLLLANYGMGKSFVASRLYLQLADDYINDPAKHRMPLFLPGANVPGAIQEHAGSILPDVCEFLNSNGFENVSLDDVDAALVNGAVTLVLDGLDEIPFAQTMSAQDVLSRIEKHGGAGKSPIIATSRTGLFARALSDVPSLTAWRIAELLPWDDSQWTTFVDLCLGRGLFRRAESADINEHLNSRRFLNAIDRDARLKQLTVTPLYCRMLVEMWPRVVSEEFEMGLPAMYQEYAERILFGRMKSSLLGTQKQARLQCLELLASHCFKNRTPDFLLDSLFEVAKSFIRQVGQDELLSFISTDLQTYSLVRCDSRGRLSFSHKSFYEYFFALALLRQIDRYGWFGIDWLDNRLEQGEAAFVADLLRAPGYSRLRDDFETARTAQGLDSRHELRRNFVVIALEQKADFGAFDFGTGEVALDLSGLDFSRRNLREAKLPNVNATRSNFSYADLSGATLVRANLSACSLEGTDLRGAKLQGATLTNIDYSQTTPHLAGARLRHLTLSRRDLAYLTFAVESDEEGDTKWRDQALAELKDAVIV